NQPPGVVERLKGAADFTVRKAHAHRLTEAGGAGEPVGADGGEVLASVPLRDPSEHFYRQRAEKLGRRHYRAGGGDVGRRKIGIGGMALAIGTDTDGDGTLRQTLAFDPDTGEL